MLYTGKVAAIAVSAFLCFASRGVAQAPPVLPLAFDPANSATGSTDEETLFLLALAGRVPLRHATIRELPQRLLDSLARIGPAHTPTRSGWRLSGPNAGLWYNSGQAAIEPDRGVWIGRGVTAAASGGGIYRRGVVSIALRPQVFWTQNRAFDPPLGRTPAELNFASPSAPTGVDIPYRFGPRSYGRFDPGESFIQLDWHRVMAGFSTATQAWGPMHQFPLLLAPNAGGFPHVMAGSSEPWNIGIGSISGRAVVGRLDQSAYAPDHPGDNRRLASELVGTFTPRGLEGLEIGGGRFFHRQWPADGVHLDVLRIPFEAFLKRYLPRKDIDAVPDNQLANAFVRIAPPGASMELYGEFLRDDHSLDLQDLLGEPDHQSGYGIGVRKVWSSHLPEKLSALTIEVVNTRISHLSQRRGEPLLYVHSPLTEGHTERGLLLAAPEAFGGGGVSMEWTHRTALSRWSVAFRSTSVGQNAEGGTWKDQRVGLHTVEFSRSWTRARGEHSLTVNGDLPWNSQSGHSNIGIAWRWRPTVPSLVR